MMAFQMRTPAVVFMGARANYCEPATRDNVVALKRPA
jgi:hypothetical protein